LKHEKRTCLVKLGFGFKSCDRSIY